MKKQSAAIIQQVFDAIRIALWSLLLCQSLSVGAASLPPLDRLQVPPGFSVSVFARLENPRQMTWADGVLYVGSMAAGKVYAIPVSPDYKAQAVKVLAQGYEWPVGVAVRQNTLYFSAMSRIYKIADVKTFATAAHTGAPAPNPELVTDRFPKDRAHGWKFIAFGPDGWLYVPVGAPCNICEPNPDVYATLGRLNVDSGQWEVMARGIRNSVGFDWNPQTRSLWASSNNRDWLGDDLPPDMIVKIDAPASPNGKPTPHFGYPYCHAGKVSDPEFGAKKPCSAFTPVEQPLGAHVAPLGVRFYNGSQFPKVYQGALFVTEHGSWNRTKKSGYNVSVLTIRDDKAVRYEPFMTGFLQGEKAIGRPADVLPLPDGSLLVSDDSANVIYRVTYDKNDQHNNHQHNNHDKNDPYNKQP